MAAPATTLTPQDQELRKGRITSTRMVKLVNGQRLAVWNEMNGIADPIPDTPRMRFGRKLESVIIGAAAEDRGWRPVHYQPGTVAVGDYATSVDAIVGEERVIEAKNRGAEQSHKYSGDEATPDELVQVSWHMLVTGIRESSVCVLLGGNDLRIFDHSADPEIEAGLKEIADRFLRDHIKTGKAPPLDGSDAAADYLRKRFPQDKGPVLTADERLDALVSAYHAACSAYDAAEEAKSRTGNLLREAIGEAAGIEGRWGKVSYRASKPSTRTDWENVVRDIPSVPAELIVKHTITKPGARSLRLTWRAS